MNAEYPETFLRGLLDNAVSESGYVISEAFKFNTNKERTADDRLELSVNWEDCDGAVDTLLAQTKEGKDGKEYLHFTKGFARLRLKEVLQILKALVDRKDFGYERYPIENNPYHGNLLQNSLLKPAEVRLLTNSLAAIANNNVYLRNSGTNPYKMMENNTTKQEKEKKKAPKVSVIVPVYGVEKYIERCAKSLLEQTLDDIEYLFIDDCTPDKSIDILKQVMEDYPQRKEQVIIHRMEQNSGQAKVREWGIKNATGEFVIHCDSDDWVDTEMYSAMYEKAKGEDADVVICDFMLDDGQKQIYKKTVQGNIRTLEDYKVGVITRDVHCSTCNKLIKKELFDNELFFPKDNYGEDSAIITQLMYYAKGIVYIPKAYYIYRYNPTSISKQQGTDALLRAFRQTCNNAKLLDEFFKKKDKSKKVTYAIQYLKCMERDRILKMTSERQYYLMWIETFPEINFVILSNPLIPYKIKIRYILGRLHLYPIFDRAFH